MKYTVIGRRLIDRPTDLKATALPNSNNIKLTWSDNSQNELKFIIERRIESQTWFEPYDSVGRNVTQFADYNTSSGKTYGYRIQAKAQEFTSSYSNDDYATTGLAAPTNLKVLDQPTQTTVRIQWQDNSLIEAGFQIARCVDDGAWDENYATVGANVTQFTDDVEFLHKYTYKVCAYDNQGHKSDWSNEVEFTSGMLAGSSYPRMSAFNNNCKVLRGADGKIHLIYNDETDIYYSYSTDNGVSFADWEVIPKHEFPAVLIDISRSLTRYRFFIIIY